MNNNQPNITPIETRTPVTEANAIMCELEEIYNELTENKSSFEEYFKEVWEDNAINGVELAADFNRIIEGAPEGIDGYVPLYCIEISCAYCVQAIKEYATNKDQSTNLIWIYISEANFWRYFLKHLILSGQDERKILSSNASNAAKARLANDPKQKDLKEIKSEFYKQKEKFKNRGYTAYFVRAMWEKHPNIESSKTIEKLIARLKKKEQ